METICILLTGIAIGVIAVWLVMRGRLGNAMKEMRRLEDDINRKDADIAALADEEKRLRNELHEADNASAAARTRIDMLEAALVTARKDTDDARKTVGQKEAECRKLTGERDSLVKEVDMLHRKEEESEKKLKEQLDAVQERMTNITNELLKKRSSELEENNNRSMEHVVNPLKEKLSELSALVRTSRDKNEQNTASVKEQIRSMVECTKEIGDKAARLTNALTKRADFQGSMGEQVLGNILDSAGLRKGRDYEEQVTMKSTTGEILINDESGRRMRPDVILHFPDNKDAIIDSKVSLTAYVRYTNAGTEEEKAEALRDHIQSMRSHVDELSAKKYNEYVKKPHTTVDFVVMFVPYEGAFQTALLNDPQLWTEALQKNVCIAGELNLTVILRMIKMAWTQYDQTKNQEEVFKNANMLIQRVGLFCERFAKIGRSIKSLKDDYDECNGSLNGKQNLLIPAKRIVKLGAKDDKRIPRQEDISEDLTLFDTTAEDGQ